MNIKPHTKGLFASVPFILWIMSSFQQKLTRHAKRQEKTQPKETKQTLEPDFDMIDFGITRLDLNNYD